MLDDIIRMVLHVSMIFISVTMCICLVRAIKGPTFADRIIAINMMCVKTILLIVIVGSILEEAFLVDVALVYALLSFVAIVVLTRIMLRSHFEKPLERDDENKKEAPGEE